MKKTILLLTVGTLCAFGSHAQTASPEQIVKEGQRIAAELRSSIPKSESSIRGVLEVRSKKANENVPVLCTVVVKGDHWDTVYETGQTDTRGSEKLIVRRFDGRPNQYLYAKAPAPKAALPQLQEIKPETADIPLAGSDFWLTDLGLDFLHWPQQRRPLGEMRLGQWCHVLESIAPNRGAVSKVVSWIDKDSADMGVPGILIAEAYSPANKKVKEFSLSGSSFKKVNGQWQLEKMEIKNLQTGSETTLRFDLSSINDDHALSSATK